MCAVAPTALPCGPSSILSFEQASGQNRPLLSTAGRMQVRGKFFYQGDAKVYLRGVTYGTFCPDDDGFLYPRQDVLENDFRRMVVGGINTVRTYTVPPQRLLDAAARHGLSVMVGLSWPQHLLLLQRRVDRNEVRRLIREGVRRCREHPAVLCYTVGNEIDPAMVRWYGSARVEHFLRTLYDTAKDEDPQALVSYVSYPPTAYLQLPFVDFVSFNVYLEQRDRLAVYLAKLHNAVDDRPLVLTEVGLDSLRNGEQAQADALRWQLQCAFEHGCAGAYVFSWTDEWYYVGKGDIYDWGFGITTRDRRPKKSFAAVRDLFAQVPAPEQRAWPMISAVVCTHNGARTLDACLKSLVGQQYPRFEVIVVNDGSTDETETIARRHPVGLISTANQGLSAARNTGWQAARGEIVAYIDDDAYADPHWLMYLAMSFQRGGHAAVGGPNIPPLDASLVAACVAHAPGGPNHVLTSDELAEHIPGCNMALRRSVLEQVGGFDPQFNVAGDDVDMCWRVHDHGGTIGFNPAAVVWHHRRNTVAAYLRQQRGYGRAEAMLARKWPGRFNAAGHIMWHGSIYGRGIRRWLDLRAPSVYQGIWGRAPFQSIYERRAGPLAVLSLMPEWYLLALLLCIGTAFGLLWAPLLCLAPLTAGAIGLPIVQSLYGARRSWQGPRPSKRGGGRLLLTGLLHLSQPAARLTGRLANGLLAGTRRLRGLCWPLRGRSSAWCTERLSVEQWLTRLSDALTGEGAAVRCGGPYDNWDLQVQNGVLAAVRLRLVIEVHAAGDMVYIRFWPAHVLLCVLAVATGTALSVFAALGTDQNAALALGAVAMFAALRCLQEAAGAVLAVRRSLAQCRDRVVRDALCQPDSGTNAPPAPNSSEAATA